MAAENYGVFENGTCTGVIVLDPEQTNPEQFVKVLGAQALIRVADHADGEWGIGATLAGDVVTPLAPEPAPVTELPDDYVPEPSDAERIANLEQTVDWLIAMSTGAEGSA